MKDHGTGQTVDITACDLEPIHAPGAVQPHASFLALALDTGCPVAGSRSLVERTGYPVEAFLGAAGLSLFDEAAQACLKRLVRHAAESGPVTLRLRDGTAFAGHAYAAGGLLMIDLEPADDPELLDAALRDADYAMRALRGAADQTALFDAMTAAIAAITRFDRVMLYRFDADWNGEVVAETRGDAAPASFKGMKFPASDIPRQARALFLRNRVRQIADVCFGTSPIEPPLNPLTDTPYDLSDSQVRAVSPVHIEYLMNMGVRASLVIALMRGNALWGLIACHHYQGPRATPPRLRSICGLLCEAFSAELGRRLSAAHAEKLQACSARLDGFSHAAEAAARAGGGEGFERFLADIGSAVLAEVGADGLCVWIGQQEVRLGADLPREEAVDLVLRARRMTSSERGRVVSQDIVPANGEARVAAGFAYAPMGTGGDGALAFRRESVIPEFWAGDPDKCVSAPDAVGRLHPRRSFDLYRRERRGCCQPWTQGDGGALRIVTEHLSQWHLTFERARREALIRQIDIGRRELRRLALVAERANDSVVMTDAAGAITWVNAAFTALTGYAFAEVRGRRPGDILQGTDTDRQAVARLAAAIRAREAVRETLVNYNKAGQPYWIDLMIAPVFDEDGAPDLFVSIQRDVTAARQREAALAAALARATESDRLKDEFLRTLSHEVRTPLNGVIGGLALLERTMPDEKDRLLAQQVQLSGRALLALFTDMLEAARHECVDGDGPVERTTPRRLLDEATAAVAPEVAAKGLAIVVHASTPDAPVALDARRLRQILTKFAANAVKYTTAGQIRLRACAMRGGTTVRFEVEDDGPGVPPAMRDRVFDPFVQLEADIEQRRGGAGLGLAICRKLAHALGGAVGVDDAATGGALFWVEAPTHPAADTARLAGAAPL